MMFNKRVTRLVLVAAAAAAISGCASTGGNPKDPYEGFNRAMFSFNDTVDRVALKPAATAYRDALPGFVQTGIGNFFGNIGDVWTAVNNLLQGKVEDGMSDVARVALNSTFGLLGLIDVASDAGLPKHREDFGQTLGHWGGEAGPYVVLPFLGSSTVRDTFALPFDFYGDPWGYKDPVSVRNIGRGVRVIDKRAGALEAGDLVEEAALDKYEFVRDAYLQRRQNQIDDDGEKHVPDYDSESGVKPQEGAKPPASSAAQR
ncbi:MAG: transporter [Burkholderiaceae bacterium]|nr:transporter [Burkholderiaceae bacterium]